MCIPYKHQNVGMLALQCPSVVCLLMPLGPVGAEWSLKVPQLYVVELYSSSPFPPRDFKNRTTLRYSIDQRQISVRRKGPSPALVPKVTFKHWDPGVHGT